MMTEYIERNTVMDVIMRYGIGWGNAKVKGVINSIPAADVRPVVRGRWIGNKRHQSCSECHMTYCVPDGQDGELDMTSYHFCPNCGADMREAET